VSFDEIVFPYTLNANPFTTFGNTSHHIYSPPLTLTLLKSNFDNNITNSNINSLVQVNDLFIPSSNASSTQISSTEPLVLSNTLNEHLMISQAIVGIFKPCTFAIFVEINSATTIKQAL